VTTKDDVAGCARHGRHLRIADLERRGRGSGVCLRTSALDHPLREVDAVNVVPGLCEKDGEAACPAADVQNRCRRGRKQRQDQVGPGGPNGRVEQAVIRLVVEGCGFRVPILRQRTQLLDVKVTRRRRSRNPIDA
jgi:hypothetical protein